MNQNMIGRMALIAAIILAAPAIVMTLTQQAFAETATAIGALAANRADVTQSTSTECTSTSAGPLTVLSISITVCKSEPPSSAITQSASATNSGAVTATASGK